MYLTRLTMRGFRNLADQTLEFPPEGIALVAPNGQGKTNLLEAVYYLEIFRSFRGAPDEQLVRFGEEVFWVGGGLGFPGGGEWTVAAGFERRGRRKRIAIGGNEPDRIGDALGELAAVVFTPSDVAMVAGAPSERRRFLDIVLSLCEPAYLGLLQRFRQALRSRNSLLRSGAGREVIAAYDQPLVRAGSRVIDFRRRWIAEQAPTYAERYQAVAGDQRGRLVYEPGVQGADAATMTEAEIADHFHVALAAVADREARRGMTLIGPHRDDLRLEVAADDRPELGWTDVRTFGSGGQQRTAAIALRMIEADSIRARRSRTPLLLLDDIFAELDAGRSERILAWIESAGAGQVLLTAPKQGDVGVRGGALPRWTIREGKILPA